MMGNETAALVVETLLGRGLTLATAESCTGGGIGAEITSVPGSSGAYLGGIISYTNAVKEKLLGVPCEMLERFGAVSAPVAEAMAAGVRKAVGSDFAVSVTGLAGPDGDAYGNPVGTVFLGFADKTGSFSRKYSFPGSRAQVRAAAVEAVLRLVLEMLK